MEQFIKVGRIYWIKPKPIYGKISKERPGIALLKYDKGKTIFIQIGTTNSKIPSSVKATNIFKSDILNLKTKLCLSNLHLDVSKPEWNTSLIKPFLESGCYVDLGYKATKKIRNIYFTRRANLRSIRIRKAKIAIINNNISEGRKQLILLKSMEPIKYKKMNVEDMINKFKKI